MIKKVKKNIERTKIGTLDEDSLSSIVKIYGEVTLCFPIIVGETFAKDIKRASKIEENEKKDEKK